MPLLLTDRQADVLRLLCAGKTYRQAATALGIARSTLAEYVVNARERLGPGTIPALCARCPDDLAAAAARERRRAETS